MKNKWSTIVAVVALLAVVLGAYNMGKSQRNSDMQGQIDDILSQMGGLLGLNIELEKQKAEIEGFLAIEKANRQIEAEKYAALEHKNAGLLAQNAEYKKQIANMTDAQVVTEIGLKVGEENVASITAIPPFSFGLTRVGGEKTVAIFKDAETYFSLAESRLLQIGTFQARVNSLELSLDKETALCNSETAAKNDAIKTLGDAKTVLENVRKDLKKSRLVNTAKGAALGVAFAVVVHSLFGK